MHGIIHVVFKSYVEVTWSAAAWVACLRKANLMDDETLLSPIGHPDSHSWALFNAACEQRDLPMDELLEQFGYFFVEYVVEEGYITFLHSMGRNLFELISNINMLHNTVLKGEKAVVFPLLEVSHISGDPEAPDHRFRLCYGSNRAGLAVFLLGIVRGVAHILFNSKVDFKDTSTEDPASLPMMTVQHSWVVTVKRNPEGMPETPKRTKSKPGNFFEFHSFVSSIFSCHCEPCDETSRSQMKSQEMGPEVRSIVLEKQEDIERIMEAYNGLEEHDESYESLVSSLSMPDRVRMAAVLFRGIYAKHVAAPWNELEQRPDVADFWDVQGHGDNCYRISKDWLGGGETMAGTRIKNGYIIFVSHCWNAPTGWAQTMKRTSFPQTKAAELCSYAKEAAKALYGDAASWGRLGFWIDKACIPQSDPNMMALSVNLLEEFIALSDGMIVLASWNYFSRMWCVYEWVCGLLIHSAMQIEIVADQLIRDSTLDTYLLCIRNFSVARCNCNSERDRQILIDKVEAYYKSVEDFEKFFQFSVIVCFCRFVAKRRTSKSNMLIPWAELASACGFSTLAKHMRRLSQVLPRFHTEAARTVQGCTDDVQAALGSLVDDWFTTNIAPLLLEEEVKATNHLGMTYITSLRLMTESAKQSEETLPQFLERIENLHGELLRTKRRALHSDAFLPFKNSVVAKKREPPSRERSWEFGTTTVGTIVSTDDSSTALSAFMRSAALRHRA